MSDEQIESLLTLVRMISHGDNVQAMGLESVTMALQDGLADIANAIREKS